MYQHREGDLYLYDTSDGRYFHKFAADENLKAMSKICYLLKRNMSIDEALGVNSINYLKQSNKGKTLLDDAVNQIHVLDEAMTKTLLNKYISEDINKELGTSHDIMHDLAQRGQFKAIEYLQNRNPNLKTCFENKDQLSPRGYGIKAGQEEYLKLAKIPINEQNFTKAKHWQITQDLLQAAKLGGIIDVRDWLLNYNYHANDWKNQLKDTYSLIKSTSPQSLALIDLLETEVGLLG